MNDSRLGPSWNPCGNQAHPSRTKLENLLASKPRIQCSLQKKLTISKLQMLQTYFYLGIVVSKLPKVAMAFGAFMERNNHKHQGQQVHPGGRRFKCVHHLRFNGGKSNPHRLIGHASHSIEGQHPPSLPVSTPWCCMSGIFCWCSTFSFFLANLR